MANGGGDMSGSRVTIGGAAGVCGLLAGVVAGVTAVALAGTAVAQLASGGGGTVLEATHLPPLLAAADERVELRYDVYCAASADLDAGETCDATGTVFVRQGDSGAFGEIPLVEAESAAGRSLAARVPSEIARSRSGFSYYAVLHSKVAGRTLTLPAGGAASPHRSLPLDRPQVVVLGTHEFGHGRAASVRLISAPWGSGPGEIGLEQGRNLAPIGGSSFDVAQDGAVSVLDEANRRLLRWRAGAGSPEHVPLAVRGTLGDLLVADDGAIHVLETTAEADGSPLLRVFERDGRLRASIEMSERPVAVRAGADGPVVLRQPSGQWVSAAVDGRSATPSEHRRTGHSGRPLPGGGELVVLRHGNEIRAALIGRSDTRRTWRVTSETALAEVQLAEPYGTGVLLVVRVYTDDRDEFVVLTLGQNGVVNRFSLSSSDWAETAPLSRFRLMGSSLYQLGSTPAGLFVDRFDLEVR
jgi:hypothetical protein